MRCRRHVQGETQPDRQPWEPGILTATKTPGAFEILSQEGSATPLVGKLLFRVRQLTENSQFVDLSLNEISSQEGSWAGKHRHASSANPPTGIHADRAARGRLHHWHPHWPAPACGAAGPGIRGPGPVWQ